MTPPSPPSPPVGDPRDGAAPKPLVPDHELLRRVGRGGYGDVWLGRNIMGVWRAIKVVYRDRFDDARPSNGSSPASNGSSRSRGRTRAR
jgi:hypothetical protein